MHHARLGIRSRERVQLIEITDGVQEQVHLSECREGTCLVFVPHTTAAVTVNENADPSVVRDLRAVLDRLIPAQAGYAQAEGSSDAHAKAMLVGCSVLLPVREGRLALGTWQGVWFREFDGPRSRSVDVQVAGSP